MSFPKLASCRNITRSAKRLAPFATVFLSCLLCETLALGQDVRTYHNNNARTGLYTAETILTIANVNATSFGKLFPISVDGKVDAQPLYLSSVGTKSGTHNLLIVASR